MPILADYGCNEQEYIDQEKHKDSVCPVSCPWCGGESCLIGHGYYQRKAKDEQRAYFIWVKRWLCKICHRTLSVLPNFLFCYRHYLVRVIQAVVVAFYECGQNWKQVPESCAQQGTPGLRTMQRWCKAFAKHAPTWLCGAQTFLAQQDSSSSWLDPQGEAAQAANAATALLGASLHLLAWAKTQWSQLVGYGLNDRLRFLGLWGAGQGLGRLV
jgi:transposase-like protein